MSCYFGYKNKGFTIEFQTREVSLEEAVELWNRIDPKKLLDFTEETGHNTVVYHDNLALFIDKTRKHITVRCGKAVK